MENLPHDIKWLNLLPPNEAAEELLKCCGSQCWASQLAAERPFTSAAELLTKATKVWWSLEPDHWLEAFRRHPQIGESKRKGSNQSQKNRAGTARTWAEPD